MEAADFISISEKECWERGCAGKDPYPTEAAALAHVIALYRGRLRVSNDRLPRQEWGLMLPYKCLFGNHWHVGHPR